MKILKKKKPKTPSSPDNKSGDNFSSMNEIVAGNEEEPKKMFGIHNYIFRPASKIINFKGYKWLIYAVSIIEIISFMLPMLKSSSGLPGF